MSFIVPEPIEAYAEAHSTSPADFLTELAEETRAKLAAPQMMVGPLEGRFLEMLVWLVRPAVLLEIGTFSGYSSLSMASALPDGGRIITCDINPTHLEVARRHVASSPHAGRIDIREGPALDTIAGLDGPFDLVFIDADKTNYRNYYEAVLPKLSDRGLIVADNVLWSGRVIDDSATDADTVAIREFNDHVRADPRVVCSMVTVRDGVMLIRKGQ